MTLPVLHLRTPPGIGDVVWLWMKLCRVADQVDLRFSSPADDVYNRAEPLFSLFQPPATFLGRESDWTTVQCVEQTVDPTLTLPELLEAGAGGRPVFLSVNHHLETGERIEDFLPDLEVEWRPPLAGDQLDVDVAQSMLEGRPCPIAIYASAYSSVRHWGFWGPGRWNAFTRLVEASLRQRVTWIIIGAKYDHDCTMDLIRKLRGRNADLVSQLGMRLGIALELLRRVKYVFAFPSGIPILSGLIGTPTMMFFPDHLEDMRYSFVSEEDRKSGRILHLPFMDPNETHEFWMTAGMPHVTGKDMALASGELPEGLEDRFRIVFGGGGDL